MTAPAQQPPDPQQDKQTDLKHIAEALAAALLLLLLKWRRVKTTWTAELIAQIKTAIGDDDLTQFGHLAVDSGEAATILHDAMTELGATSAAQVVDEARAQGVHEVQPVEPDSGDMRDQADVAAALLASALATSAGAEAIRVHRPGPTEDGGSTAAETARKVQEHLDSLTDAQPEYVLGAALHGAQNAARIATLAGAGDVAIIASEVNDAHICLPCGQIDGRRLKDFGSDDWSQVYANYPVRGYINCLGRDRCRGTVVGLWQKEST